MNSVHATISTDPDGKPRGFTLIHEQERVVLEPGRSWFQTDHFKWVTRGLIEAPQSFVVHPDGAVDFNGETYRPAYAVHAEQFTAALNKRHATAAPPATRTPADSHGHHPRPRSDRVQFRVHLDHLGHPLIEAWRGEERTETGLRGLRHLVDDGWLVAPESLHVDPLQRHVEIDGVRYAADAEGARELEHVLNANYARAIASNAGVAIEIRENTAASSGFDIHFWTIRAGTRFEIKGHLSQEKLDILQDHDKCDLLKPGILLRLSPPYLYFRRRRPDGGEEHVPGLEDVKYRGLSAQVLQQLLNHPALRQSSGEPGKPPDDGPDVVTTTTMPASAPTPTPAPDPAAVPAVVPAPASTPAPFVPPPKVPPPTVVPALPPSAAAAAAAVEAAPATQPPVGSTPPGATPPAPASAVPEEDPELVRVFAEKDPHRINEGIFRQLAQQLGIPVQDVLFSLPRVFEDRRFEILDFNGEEISSVLQLRTAHFYGFYLTHLHAEHIDLVYACHGTHLEWGTGKCAVQPSAGAETVEHRHPALLGLAQDARGHFVFIVSSEYREWVRHFEPACREAYAHFVTPSEWKATRDSFHLIWPNPAP